jgi:tetratricopeptide (TPR) repeat protein
LITSRRTLNVAGELAFLVPPLSTANAAALMRRIVAGRGVDVDAAALERLAERLEGHPLTADLAAHRIVTHGPSGEAPWIAGELSGLLSGTWERLPAGARSLLGALSQLPQGAPAGLCAALVRAPRDVEEAMAWGLCRQFQERLLAHALVREFVAATPEGRAAIPHLWRAYHEQAAIQVAHYNGGHQARALEWFRSERTNLDALLGLPACAGAEPAAALFRSVWQLYLWTGASAAGLRAFEALGGTERAADLALEAATLHYFLGEHAQAERLARLVTLRATSAEAHQAHYLLSTASRALGRLDVAEREMQAGLRLCEERPDRREHPNFLKELGVIADALGRHDEAAELLQRAIAEYQGNRVAEGFAVQCLGRVERHRSNRQTARELAERSLLQGRDLDEPRVQGYSRRDLATLALDEGRFREAAALLDAARQDFLRADHRAALRWLELDRARIDLAEGRLTVAWEALVALEKALSAEQQLEGALAARLQLVELLCLCGRRRGARVWLAPCQGMAEVLGQPRWAQKVAQWQALLDKDPRALEEVRDGWERLGDRWAAARCRLALAELRGDGAAELSALFQDALDREDPCAEARISLRLSEGYLAEGTIDDAASCAAHAEALTERHGTALEQAEAASIVARVALLRGSGGEAPVTMLREASRTFLAHGQVHMLATAWAALPHPTARERDLVRLTRVSSSVELLATTLEDPALKRLVERHSMRFSGSGAGLARRLVERTSARPPGSDDLESLCEQWIAELA